MTARGDDGATLTRKHQVALRWCLIAGAIYTSTSLTARLLGALQFLTLYDDTLGALVALALLVWLRHARARQTAPPPAGSPQSV